MRHLLHLDFIPPRPRTFSWGAFVIAVSLLGIISEYYLQIRQQVTQSLVQYNALSSGKALPHTNLPEILDSSSIEKMARIAKIAEHLAVPWDAIFSAVERIRPEEISVLMLEPLIAKKQLTIQAEARDMQNMLRYVETLQKQPIFTNVMLLKHDIVQDDPEHPVRFVVQAQWVAP
jgi:hypothetical protein